MSAGKQLAVGILLLCLGTSLFAVNPPDGEQARLFRLSWTSELDHAAAYDVILEKLQDGTFRESVREISDTPQLYAALTPGDYRLRIIPYDTLGRTGVPSAWSYFTIAPPAPTESPAEAVAEAVADASAQQAMRFFVGVHSGVSAYARYNAALGGGLTAGANFNSMGAGIILLYAQDEEKMNTIEIVGAFRYYLLRAHRDTGLFAQAETGVAFFTHESREIDNPLALAAGLKVGWRFPLGMRFYLEPAVGVGTPYLYNAGITAGLRF